MNLRTRILLLAYNRMRGRSSPFFSWGEWGDRSGIGKSALIRALVGLGQQGLIRLDLIGRELEITPAGVAAVREILRSTGRVLADLDAASKRPDPPSLLRDRSSSASCCVA